MAVRSRMKPFILLEIALNKACQSVRLRIQPQYVPPRNMCRKKKKSNQSGTHKIQSPHFDQQEDSAIQVYSTFEHFKITRTVNQRDQKKDAKLLSYKSCSERKKDLLFEKGMANFTRKLRKSMASTT